MIQKTGDHDTSKRSYQALVSAHWKRGAELLKKDWAHAGGEMAGFVARLAELAEFAGEGVNADGNFPARPSYVVGDALLPVGELARDTKTGESVQFALNAAGGSPHMAIMGGVGAGKTRTAVCMLRALRDIGKVPLLAFDFKGDLADGLSATYDAVILSPPNDSIPLDVLHVASNDENAIKIAAARIRDSIASVKLRRPSGIQSEALREAVAATLRLGVRAETATLSDVANALEIGVRRSGAESRRINGDLERVNSV